MKKSQVLAVAGATLLASGVLAACSNTSSNNAKLAKDYQYVYQTDPETLDYIVSNIDSTSFITTNAVDGLLANDKYGNLVPSIAESWTVSKDGLTYTYKIRKDAKWVTAEGEEYAPVTAKTSDAQKTSTQKALLNKEFRQALNFAVDRNSYSAQTNGTDGAAVAIRNTFAPYNLQVGKKTFGELVQDSLAKTNSSTWSNVSLADSQNGLYNEEKAKEVFAKAKSSLQAEGVEFPIHLDALVIQESTAVVNRVQSLKQSIEKVLGSDNVVVDLQQMTQAEALPISFSAPTAKEQDWDIHTLLGWNPDYQDPSTFLDQFVLKGGSTRLYLGIDQNTDASVVSKLGLADYGKLLDDANSENQDVQKRYEKYAVAQAWLTDNALTIPVMASPKETAVSYVSKVLPFSSSYSVAGLKGENSGYLKYTEVGEKAITKEEYEKAREKWLKEKTESNEKAQKELASHVK